MIIYRTFQTDPVEGQLYDWFEYRREAKKHLEYMEDDVAPYGVEAIEIECTKAGVLNWLNLHFKSDNGQEAARVAQLERDASSGC